MKLILYQGDGVSIKDSMRKMTYNYMRSHHYLIFKLAKALNCINVMDGNPGVTKTILSGSDVFYTLKEFPEYNLDYCTLADYKDSIGVLPHMHVDPSSYYKILNILGKSRYFIYYCSDPEFATQMYRDYPMLLQFIKENPEDKISKLFRSRCIAIITGFHSNLEYLDFLEKPVFYIPQIVNPNIPRINCEKYYDIWMINTTPLHKKWAEYFMKEGLSVLSLVRNHEYIPGQDYIECTGAGLNLDILLSAVGMCKYYFGRYPMDPTEENFYLDEKYSWWNHTSKVLESYYANTYWINTTKNLDQCLTTFKSDQWKNQKSFNSYVERNFSFKNYEEEFKRLVQCVKESIK